MMSTRVLLDAGVISHSEFAEYAIKEVPMPWAGSTTVSRVHVLRRKQRDRNEDHEKQMEALFTVGRLIREGRVEAYTYNEIEFERSRGRMPVQEFNALQGCAIGKCDPALERSRFRRTIHFIEYCSKGGKKDRREGVPLGSASQIAFLEWLCTLDKRHANALIEQASVIGLSPFEIDSLRNLEWFKLLCDRSMSSENYPDVFHLWTAERNQMDAFLTLDTKLPRLVGRVRGEKKSAIQIRTEALLPLDLLKRLGIATPDAVPIDSDREYNLY